MTPKTLKNLLSALAKGELSVEEAYERLRDLPYEDLTTVRLDHHRGLRKHFPEIIYGPGKNEEELQKIVESFLEKESPFLVTRISEKMAVRLKNRFPQLEYYERARLLGIKPEGSLVGQVAVVSAGTADLPVAEEARIAAEYFGNRVEAIYDVGVAGIHRLFPELKKLRAARAIIVVAGMEGALPSVVAGLVDRPVIAVPTSVGYGANFGGLAPLLAMLNTCAMGVTVVNIDNGVGAAYFASIINHMLEGKNGKKRS
ncbi:MAG TPA: nickel pincer cofactor biosynthesis protein LarB [Thermodesulfobacteriaceae bacterium]|nr:nickel pincer cofactor biosynthesis protein LarB [Thermodesulfobacteriaceae bacterium]